MNDWFLAKTIIASSKKKGHSGHFLNKLLIYPLTPDTHQALEQHVIVYNPLAWNITTIINTTVAFPVAAVFDDDGQPVPAQVCVTFVNFYLKK